MKHSVQRTRRVYAAVGAAIVMLLLIGALTFYSLALTRDSDHQVRHTYDVLEHLGDETLVMQTMQSYTRGFLLTRDETFVGNFNKNALVAKEHAAAIRALVEDNSLEIYYIAALDDLLAQRIAYMEGTINKLRANTLQTPELKARFDGDAQLMVVFMAAIHQMESEERQLLNKRVADSELRVVETEAVIVFGIVLASLIIAAAGWAVQRFGVRHERAEQARETMEDALFAEKELAEVTLNSIGDAVACTNVAGNLTFLNLVAEKLTGWPLREAMGRPVGEILKIIDGISREAIPHPMLIAISTNRISNLPANSILVRRDGVELPIEDSVAPIHDKGGQASGAVIVFRDASASRAAALQISYTAEHDFLTGLPNRLLLSDRIGQAIALAARHKQQIALLFLDLDGFKHINDSLGHLTGDKLLQSVAERLLTCVRGADTVSRQGGDEFIILLSEIEQPEDAALTAKRVLESVAEPHNIDGIDLHVTTSIGVSVYPDDGLDAETLIKNADTAMYQAKENGRQSFKFFKPAMNVKAVERQSIEASLRRAIERQEFTLHYQPKIDLQTGAISGAEALIRWTHPTRGMISPAQFIPVAEACGLIRTIDAWVMRKACEQASAWRQAGLPPIRIAVNVSAIEFHDEAFVESLLAVLADTGLDPKCLEIELTERVFMQRADATASILQTLRESGIRIALDDFGTGYSSLSYLRKFPVDALKIDQSFIRQINASGGDTILVSTVIRMAQSLNLRTIAEGVETLEQARFLREQGCDEAQGYFFSQPLPAEQFANLLATGMPLDWMSEPNNDLGPPKLETVKIRLQS